MTEWSSEDLTFHLRSGLLFWSWLLHMVRSLAGAQAFGESSVSIFHVSAKALGFQMIAAMFSSEWCWGFKLKSSGLHRHFTSSSIALSSAKQRVLLGNRSEWRWQTTRFPPTTVIKATFHTQFCKTPRPVVLSFAHSSASVPGATGKDWDGWNSISQGRGREDLLVGLSTYKAYST